MPTGWECGGSRGEPGQEGEDKIYKVDPCPTLTLTRNRSIRPGVILLAKIKQCDCHTFAGICQIESFLTSLSQSDLIAQRLHVIHFVLTLASAFLDPPVTESTRPCHVTSAFFTSQRATRSIDNL